MSVGTRSVAGARVYYLSFMICACIASVHAQEVGPANSAPPDSDPVLAHRPAAIREPPTSQTVALIVPKDTPVQVALDNEIRVEKVGQALHGRVVEPVYAFDKIVLPVGTEVS